MLTKIRVSAEKSEIRTNGCECIVENRIAHPREARPARINKVNEKMWTSGTIDLTRPPDREEHGSTRQGKGVNDIGTERDFSPQIKKGKVKQSKETILGGSGNRVNHFHEFSV